MTARVMVAAAALVAAAAAAHGQEAVPAACERPPRAGEAAVGGRVTDVRTRLPLQEADVVLEWERAGRRRKLELETDTAGHYSACNLPPGTHVTVVASFGSAKLQESVLFDGSGVILANFELDAPRSRVAGKVVESGSSRGIPDAELRIEGSDVHAVSRADGTFQLPDVPAGRYRLTTSHIGFGSRTDSVEVQYGAIMQYTVSLAPDVIPLQPINVDVRNVVLERNGFYDRRERSAGTFLTQSDWASRAVLRPSDIMRTVQGVRVATGRYGNVVYDRGSCAFRYFVDGTRTMDNFQMDEMPVEWIEALEVYRGPAQVPPQFVMPTFSGRANCGVIVIWTKSPR